jgi:ubiquitin-conjugating enzyme E2 Z
VRYLAKNVINKLDFDRPDFHCENKKLLIFLFLVFRDIMSFYKDPPSGIFVVPDEQNLSLVHALMVGTCGTPYEGGFFYFVVRFPPTYPIDAPKVRLMTTGAGTVRFNPNLYSNGKVCLSTLGTWSGPAWSPAQCLESLLVSIQSLMCENPYHNEPGFEKVCEN